MLFFCVAFSFMGTREDSNADRSFIWKFIGTEQELFNIPLMVVSPYEHDKHSTNSLQDKCRFSLSVMHSYPFDNFISYD